MANKKRVKFYESMIKYKRLSFIALLKAEIYGCNLNESSMSFQLFTAL